MCTPVYHEPCFHSPALQIQIKWRGKFVCLVLIDDVKWFIIILINNQTQASMLIFCATCTARSQCARTEVHLRLIKATVRVSLKVLFCYTAQYKYKGKPFKIILTVYPMKPRPVRVSCRCIGPRIHPALRLARSCRFPSELQDADIALHCSKMAAVIQNPLKA